MTVENTKGFAVGRGEAAGGGEPGVGPGAQGTGGGGLSNRPLPKHGTTSRYRRGCHCGPCTAANRRWLTQWRLDRLRGAPPRTVTADPSRRRLRELAKRGVRLKAIAATTGLASCTLRAIRDGRVTTVRTSTQRKILAVRPETAARTGTVSGGVTKRQVEGLVALGWPLPWIAAQTGVDRSTLNRGSGFVRAATADAVAALAAAVGDTPGPSARARSMARRLGYKVPAAWDDDWSDPGVPEPVAVDEVMVERAVCGEPLPRRLTPAERVAALPRLRDGSAANVADVLRVCSRTARRDRQALGRAS